jgi:cell division protease FtsH
VGNMRNVAFWVVLLVLLMALFQLFTGGQATLGSQEMSYSEFVQRVDEGKVAAVTLDGERITVRGKDGSSVYVIKPQGEVVTESLTKDLLAKGIEVEALPQAQSGLMSLLMTFLPFILLIGVWVYFMNRMQGGGKGGAMGFGKSRAKMLTEKQGRVTFDDVAGIDEAKEELEEIVEFLRNPQKFSAPWRQDPEGRAAGRPSGHRQDAAGPCDCG